MTITENIQKQVNAELTDRRFVEATKKAVALLGMNHPCKVVAAMTNLKENNVQRLQTVHKGLIDRLRVQYDDHCIKNLQEDDPEYRLSKMHSKVSNKTVLLSEAKSLDHIYFELLVSTVRDERQTVASRISAYKELQSLIKKIESGESVVKAEDKPEEKQPEQKPQQKKQFSKEEIAQAMSLLKDF